MAVSDMPTPRSASAIPLPSYNSFFARALMRRYVDDGSLKEYVETISSGTYILDIEGSAGILLAARTNSSGTRSARCHKSSVAKVNRKSADNAPFERRPALLAIKTKPRSDGNASGMKCRGYAVPACISRGMLSTRVQHTSASTSHLARL